MIMKFTWAYFNSPLLLLIILNGFYCATYFIPPSYPAPAIPRGYQPPPSGPLVDEYAYRADSIPQPQQQQYTIMRFNSREPFNNFNGQNQQDQQSFNNFQSNVNSRPNSFASSNSFIGSEQNIGITTIKPHEPMLINTLIQVFAGDANEEDISLAETRSMIEGGNTTVHAIASNPNRVVVLRKLDTKSRSFLPIGDNKKNKENDSHYVVARAFAASNSSSVSKVELETELHRELEVSIPLILQEIKRLQHLSNATVTPSFSNSTILPSVITSHKPEENVKSSDLEHLIAEGLAEIDEAQSTTMPLIIFTKTTTLAKESATEPILTLSSTTVVDEQKSTTQLFTTSVTSRQFTSTSTSIPNNRSWITTENSTTLVETTTKKTDYTKTDDGKGFSIGMTIGEVTDAVVNNSDKPDLSTTLKTSGPENLSTLISSIEMTNGEFTNPVATNKKIAIKDKIGTTAETSGPENLSTLSSSIEMTNGELTNPVITNKETTVVINDKTGTTAETSGPENLSTLSSSIEMTTDELTNPVITNKETTVVINDKTGTTAETSGPENLSTLSSSIEMTTDELTNPVITNKETTVVINDKTGTTAETSGPENLSTLSSSIEMTTDELTNPVVTNKESTVTIKDKIGTTAETSGPENLSTLSSSIEMTNGELTNPVITNKETTVVINDKTGTTAETSGPENLSTLSSSIEMTTDELTNPVVTNKESTVTIKDKIGTTAETSGPENLSTLSSSIEMTNGELTNPVATNQESTVAISDKLDFLTTLETSSQENLSTLDQAQITSNDVQHTETMYLHTTKNFENTIATSPAPIGFTTLSSTETSANNSIKFNTDIETTSLTENKKTSVKPKGTEVEELLPHVTNVETSSVKDVVSIEIITTEKEINEYDFISSTHSFTNDNTETHSTEKKLEMTLSLSLPESEQTDESKPTLSTSAFQENTGKDEATFTIESYPKTETGTTISRTESVMESTIFTNTKTEHRTTTESEPTISTMISEMPEIIGTTHMHEENCLSSSLQNVTKGDVLFLLDSRAANVIQFRQSIELIWDTVKEFGDNFGPNGIQVSVVQQNKNPSLEFSFRGHKCIDGVLEDIFDTELIASNDTSNSHSIDNIIDSAFTKSRGDRPDVENVVVLVTSDAAESSKVRFPLELFYNGNTTVLIIASVEATAEDFAMLLSHGGTTQNRFNVTELDSTVPLAQRLANRIRQILQGDHKSAIVTNSGTIISPSASSESITTLSADSSFTSVASNNGLTTDFSLDNSESTLQNLISINSSPSDVTNTESSTTTFEPFNTHAHELASDLPSTTISFSMEKNAIVKLNETSVAVDCLAGGIRANFTLPANFRGYIIAKDFEEDEKCVTTLDLATFGKFKKQIVEIHHPDCGLHFIKSEQPRGINESIVLSVVHDRRLETGQDRSFVIQCFIPLSISTVSHDSSDIPEEKDEASEVETSLNIIPGMALSKTISVVGMPPKCSYSLRRDSPNGALVQEAHIGETLYHRWECENTANDHNDVASIFGLHIYDCRTNDQSGEKNRTFHQFIDKNGCTTDTSLLEDVTYANDRLLAFARVNVFTLRHVGALRFVCKVALCVRDGDGCEGYTPPICASRNSSDNSELLAMRQLRQMDSSIEAALSTELEAPSVKVLVSDQKTNAYNLANKNGNNSIGHGRLFASSTLIKSNNTADDMSTHFSSGFAAAVLVISIVLGLILGILCFALFRCLECIKAKNDDRASLVESARNSFGRKSNGYYANREDDDCFCDALSFSGELTSATEQAIDLNTVPVVNNELCCGLQSAYHSTLERRAAQVEDSTATLTSENNLQTIEQNNGNHSQNLIQASIKESRINKL